jgi:predicted phosphodiesterase
VRKNILCLWALVCLLPAAAFAPRRAAEPPPVPLFAFAVIGDSHVSTSTVFDSKYIKANDRSAALLAAYVKDINQRVPPVSFVVHLGDITDTGAEAEFDLAAGILDDLKAPLYLAVGNHDNFRSDDKREWKKLAGRDSTTYAFDFRGFHFLVIDCTENPYEAGGVSADGNLREWVRRDLARSREMPAIVFSHYNMWERLWNSQFDTTNHYQEYKGMRELRKVLEDAGNVAAVINGHVHANRVEVRGGIYYVDIGATSVGRPSVRYFSVYPDRVESDFAYISDGELLDYVVEVSRECASCFDHEKVADYADGGVADKRFTIALKPAAVPAPTSPSSN